MSDIKPYKIAVPQEKLDRLKKKLDVVDFPDELDAAGWDMGSPLKDMKRLIEHWRNGYDWRAEEAKLNEIPQFITPIEVEGFGSINVHFVHQKSEVKNALPLLFAHGWPGSFEEVRKILPELVKGGKDQPAFDVVAPSLVNFGFSEGVSKRGFTSKHHAIVCHKLMQKLGYKEYVTQGGDIGYAVTRGMAKLFPEACKATHVNMPVPNAPDQNRNPDLYYTFNQTPLSESDKQGLERSKWFKEEGFGYNLEHSTKPQTIGYSLTDSPLGLLSWIYEKLHDWTDEYPWTDDEVLTWISIYWFSTAGPAASMRVYYERQHDPEKFSAGVGATYIPDVKLGCVRFPKELFLSPKSWNETLGPLVYQSEYERGGHFAAWERPDAIVKDLREMFGKNGGAYACVKGKTGYD